MDLEKVEYWKSLINMSLTKFLILQTLHARALSRVCHPGTVGAVHKRLLHAHLWRHLSGAEGAHTGGLCQRPGQRPWAGGTGGSTN